MTLEERGALGYPARTMTLVPAAVRDVTSRLFVVFLLSVAVVGHADERPVLHVGGTTASVRVDGVLDEAAWNDAPEVTAFRLMSPREGQTPSESTSVRVLRTADRLVFAIRCEARRAPHAGLAPRDQALDGDHLAVHLDTDGDGRRAYVFGINPYGVQLDGILTDQPDFKWDGVWEGAAARGDGEWTAELAIPFRILRISAHDRPWRVWLRRECTSWNEVATWPLYRVGEPGVIMLQAADLTGLDGVRGGREFTVEPYLFAAALGDRALRPTGGTGPWSSTRTTDVGLDVQAAITPSLVANLTLNPDFSQIEADALQIRVNQRFPLNYPEKRPFFLEGADQFHTPLDLVETRRIADPEWGLKLTGRAAGWNTGALLVHDHGGASLAGSGYTTGDDARDARPGWFGVVRAQRPLPRGANVGFIAGGHTESPEADAGRHTMLGPDPVIVGGRTWNGFAGLDAHTHFGEHWLVDAQAVVTGTAFDSLGPGVVPAAVALADAPRVRPASAATRAFGGDGRGERFGDWMGVVRLRYRDGVRTLSMGTRHVGPYYRDELAHQNFIGVTYRRLGGSWDLFPKGGALQRYGPNTELLVVHDHTGRLEYGQLYSNLEFEFRRNAFALVSFQHTDEHWLTRAYPQERVSVFGKYADWSHASIEGSVEVGDAILFADEATSRLVWSESATLDAMVRPDPRLSVAANVVRLRLANRPGAADLLGVWLVGVKANAQFTRRLSLRFYPQYETSARHLDLNALLGYVVQPGTVFYAGVNSGWDPEVRQGIRRATSRQFFAKASWRFAR